MKELYSGFLKAVDKKELMRRTEELTAIEAGQTFRNYRKAAEFILAELKKNKIPNAEIVEFPADGKTSYMDKRMPIAWDASIGKLTLCDKEHTVAADYTEQPFNLIKGSVSTKKGGEILRIITEQQFLAGEDPKDALVMLEPLTWPRAKVLTPVLDQGGRGIITDYLNGRYRTPDDVQWVNACTEGANWHLQCDDRDFIGFSVSPRMGDLIRQKANSGELKAEVECDGRRYEGKLPAVTALVPGRRKEEIWLLAHTFEPLLDDDSNGVSAGIEIAKMILGKGVPEYSLRLVFAMELYGYAAFRAKFRGTAIGGCNIDSIPSSKHLQCKLVPSIGAVPFHGVEILEKIFTEFSPEIPLVYSKPECFDDMFMSDPTAGIPTQWFMKMPLPGAADFWHNSAQTHRGYLDAGTFAKYTALAAVWFHETLNFTGPQPRKKHLALKPVSSPWREYASKQVYARAVPGLPQDLVNVPKSERVSLPDGVLYGPFAAILSDMDGKKDLAEIILESEAERGETISEPQIKKYIDAVNYLADWKYLTPVKRTEITREMLGSALAGLGVKKGDLLLVHASVSRCGYVSGGAETLIRAVLDAVGTKGTALFPTFTRPYISFSGSLNKGWNYRPFDAADSSQIWTGAVPRTLLERFPKARRSRHVTHSWAGLGPLAEECVSAHGPCDPPASANSPMGKALEHGGKVLFLGTGLAPDTFLHYIETIADSACLGEAVCRVRNPDGSLKTVLIEKHLPGHRDFYRNDAENCKFYTRAVKAGLKIAEQPLGMGKLQLIDMKDLYRIGMELIRKDPRILLCDDPCCLFCRQF